MNIKALTANVSLKRQQKANEKEMLKTLKHLEEGGLDALGNIGQGALAAIGALAGATAAPLLFSALGLATTTVAVPATLFGSATVGAWLGMAPIMTTVAVATPVGWVVGGGFLVGSVAYGISKVVRNAGRQDQIRKYKEMEIQKRLEDLRRTPIPDKNEEVKELAKLLQASYYQEKLSSSIISRVVRALNSGMTSSYAIEILSQAVSGGIKDGSCLLTDEEKEKWAKLKLLPPEQQLKVLSEMAQK